MVDHLGHVQGAVAVFFHWVPVGAWALASGILCLLIQFCCSIDRVMCRVCYCFA